MKYVLTCLLLSFFGCSGSVEPTSEMGRADASFDMGARFEDGVVDTGPTAPDAAPDAAPDVGTPDASEADGFGTISGACGVLDDELIAMAPALFESAIDFAADPYDDADLERLTAGGQEIIADGNAGGSSLLSEVFAYEVLERCEGAVLVKTETEVVYDDPMGKITDLLVDIDGTPIGVSVTRAVGFPREDPYTVAQAEMLLTDKLNDVEASSANVSAVDAWAKQVLHVIAYAPGHADSLRVAYESLPADVVDDTIVWVTVSDGDDEFLY